LSGKDVAAPLTTPLAAWTGSLRFFSVASLQTAAEPRLPEMLQHPYRLRSPRLRARSACRPPGSCMPNTPGYRFLEARRFTIVILAGSEVLP